MPPTLGALSSPARIPVGSTAQAGDGRFVAAQFFMRLIKRCLFVVVSSVFDHEKFKQFRTTRRFTMYSVETVDK